MYFNDEIRKEWENATPNHRFIFAKLMEDEEVCIGVLETFLQVQIDHIVYLKTEESIEKNFMSKGIRMDVYLRDEQGSIYNVEMQRENLKDLPKRSRYYQSLIDLNVLKKGEEYEKLCASFIIFICNFDPFDRNRCFYYFENRDRWEDDLVMGDFTSKLFFNTKGEDKDQIDPRLRMILEFFDDHMPDETAEDPLLQKMTDLFYKIKANYDYEVSFMTQAVYENDLRKLGFRDGYESAKFEYDSLLRKSEALRLKNEYQYRKSEAKLTDKIAQLEAALAAALSHHAAD